MLRTTVFPRPLPEDAFALRISAFYIAIFLLVGCYQPFMPLWLKWRGLTDFQISLTFAIPVFLRAIFTPAMTFAADRYGRPARLLNALAWGAVLSVATLPFAAGFPAIFAVIVVYTLFWMSVLPITDSLALAGARAGRADYGQMRLWGSLSYIVMTAAGGFSVDLWGPRAALVLFIGAAVTVLIVSYALPGDDADGGAEADGAPTPKRTQLRIADMTRLMAKPDLWLFLAATSTIQGAHVVYYIFGTLHWTSAGIPPSVIGPLWGIGVIAEIVLFAYARRVGRWVGPVQLLAIAAGAAVIRWTITAFDPPLALLFLVQSLHGLTFGAAHLGAMHFMDKAIPHRLSASAQGLYASITMGIGMGSASLMAGPLYRNFGGGAYLAMAGLGLAGLAISFVLMRRWRGGPIVARENGQE